MCRQTQGITMEATNAQVDTLILDNRKKLNQIILDMRSQLVKAKQQVADKAKEAADAARKTGVGVALWAFISLLVGAFSASYMATVGGRQRDEAPLFE